MNERPHPTAEDFLAYCDREIAKAIFPVAMTSGKGGMSCHAARIQMDICSARVEQDQARFAHALRGYR